MSQGFPSFSLKSVAAVKDFEVFAFGILSFSFAYVVTVQILIMSLKKYRASKEDSCIYRTAKRPNPSWKIQPQTANSFLLLCGMASFLLFSGKIIQKKHRVTFQEK